jgi:hypothetical protein
MPAQNAPYWETRDKRRSLMGRSIIIVLALAVGCIRPFIPTEPLSWSGSYQAVAHLLVGGLIGAAIALFSVGNEFSVARQKACFCLNVAVVLSIVELVCFLAKKVL